MGARDRQPGGRGRHRGFTLGEVLGVLGIVGVSVSLAVPGLTSVLRTNERAESINALVRSLHLAHGHAVTRLRQITVCPSPDGRACQGSAWDAGWIQFEDLDRDGQVTSGEQILETVGAVAGFGIRSDEFRHYLAVAPTGRVEGNDGEIGGRFAFCPAGGTEGRIVAVTGAGAPLLLEPGMPGALPDCDDGT